jgi:hypothetical protein
MTTRGEAVVQFHVILISALYTGEWPSSSLGRVTWYPTGRRLWNILHDNLISEVVTNECNFIMHNNYKIRKDNS